VAFGHLEPGDASPDGRVFFLFLSGREASLTLSVMKISLLLFPLFPLLLLFLWSCADRSSREPPIVKVRPVRPHQAALKATIPQSRDALEVSMSSLPEQVRENNLSLAAARRLVAEARGKLESAGLLNNPDLQVSFQTSQRFENFMLTVGISKEFPRTNRLLLEKRVSAILVEAARAEVRDAERLIVGQAREALVDILALRQRKELLASQEANARKLTEFIAEAAAQGEASPLDAGTALLEATRLSNQVKQVAIREFLAVAKLKPLLGMKPAGTVTVTGSLADPEMPRLNVTTYRRPDLEAARLRSRSAKEATDLAHARKLNDLEAGIFAGVGRELDEPSGFEAESIVGFRLTIPLGENPAALGKVRQSEARADRLALGALALERVANNESHAAYAEMKEWQVLAVQIKSQLLPLADTQIQKTEEAREKGQVALRDVLLAKEQKLALETSYLEAVRDFHLAYARYLTATAQ